MNEDLVDQPFKSAVKKVDDAYSQAAKDMRAKVEKATSEALKKVSQ